MPREYKIEQGDLTLELRFEKPDFVLLGHNANRFIANMFPFLERYGSTPHEVTFGTAQIIGDRYVNIMAPRVNAGVKLSANKVDVGFNDLMKVQFTDVQSITLGTLGALNQIEGASKIAGYIATLNVHGSLDGMTAAEFIGRFFKSRPKGLGTDTGGALGFYYGVDGPRLNCSVILDGSVLVQGGMYARISVAYDAKQIKPDEVLNVGKQQLGKVFSALELTQSKLDL